MKYSKINLKRGRYFKESFYVDIYPEYKYFSRKV